MASPDLLGSWAAPLVSAADEQDIERGLFLHLSVDVLPDAPQDTRGIEEHEVPHPPGLKLDFRHSDPVLLAQRGLLHILAPSVNVFDEQMHHEVLRQRFNVEVLKQKARAPVMEEKHKSRLLAEYGRMLEQKAIHVLDIPDQYRYMDPDLVDELERSVEAILGLD